MLQRHISVVVPAAGLALIALLAALSGCGQKGPLTLPKAGPAASAPASK